MFSWMCHKVISSKLILYRSLICNDDDNCVGGRMRYLRLTNWFSLSTSSQLIGRFTSPSTFSELSSCLSELSTSVIIIMRMQCSQAIGGLPSLVNLVTSQFQYADQNYQYHANHCHEDAMFTDQYAYHHIWCHILDLHLLMLLAWCECLGFISTPPQLKKIIWSKSTGFKQ